MTAQCMGDVLRVLGGHEQMLNDRYMAASLQVVRKTHEAAQQLLSDAAVTEHDLMQAIRANTEAAVDSLSADNVRATEGAVLAQIEDGDG